MKLITKEMDFVKGFRDAKMKLNLPYLDRRSSWAAPRSAIVKIILMEDAFTSACIFALH